MNELHIYSFGGRGISPFDRSGGLIVVDRCNGGFFFGDRPRRKRCSSNDLPLNFGEPDFELVKPGRVGGWCSYRRRAKGKGTPYYQAPTAFTFAPRCHQPSLRAPLCPRILVAHFFINLHTTAPKLANNLEYSRTRDAKLPGDIATGPALGAQPGHVLTTRIHSRKAIEWPISPVPEKSLQGLMQPTPQKLRNFG
jgi:hypothetical protein